MYEIFRTSSFKKDYKKITTEDKEILKEVITTLANGEILDSKYKDHNLIGNYLGCRECHLKPDFRIDINTCGESF